MRRRQPLVDHAVPVRVDGRAELPPFGAVDQDGPAGLGAEVDPERVASAHGRLRPLGLDDDLQAASLHQLVEGLAPLRQRVAAAHEPAELDLAGLHEPDRPREIGGLHAPAERQGQALSPRGRGGEARPVALGDADEDDAASGPDGGHGIRKRRVLARGFERHVDPSVVERRTQGRGCVGPVSERVARHDRLHPGGPQGLDEQQPERPAAEHTCGRPGSRLREVEGVQRHAERLEQRPLRVREAPREGVGEPFGPDEARAQGAVCRAVPGEPKVGAEVRIPAQADAATAARHGGVERHALARAGAGLDRPHEFVPEDKGAVEDGVADPPFEEPVPVRPAQADGGHAHENLAVARLRRRLVVEPEIACAVEAKGLHGRWP